MPIGAQVGMLRSALSSLPGGQGPIVVDCGALGSSLAVALAGAGAPSVLVTRTCYLALRRVASLPVRPDGVIVVHEAGRALGPAEVEDIVGAPVLATVDVDPGVARAVDAGLLATRLPRGLARSLAAVAAVAGDERRRTGR